jgi:hypothetical protein
MNNVATRQLSEISIAVNSIFTPILKGLLTVKTIAFIALTGLIVGCSSTLKMDEPLPAEMGLVMINTSCEAKSVGVMALSTKTSSWFPEKKIGCGKAMGIDTSGPKLLKVEAGNYFLIGQGASPRAEFAYEVEVLPGKINYFGSVNAGHKIEVVRSNMYSVLKVEISDTYGDDVAVLKAEYPDYPWNFEVVMSIPEKEYDIPK